MARKHKPPRDPSKLTGKPLSQTVIPSHIYGSASGPSAQNAEKYTTGWLTSPDLYETDLKSPPAAMEELSNFLLANPHLNASHLFRADILFDSSGELKTPREKERLLALKSGVLNAEDEESSREENDGSTAKEAQQKFPPVDIEGLELTKTVVLTLIPRNLNLDKPMDQTCHFYKGTIVSPGKTVERLLYIRYPHIDSVEDMPFYHPRIRGFAFMYEFEKENESSASESIDAGKGTLSLHILPFPATEDFDPFPTRLERTLQALLNTQVRLARSPKPTSTTPGSPGPSKQQADESYNPLKDNLLPRHLIQNTYTRLKLTYAQDLCQNWAETTEPSKHVFEDLAITAFLIELWRNMYGVAPKAGQDDGRTNEKDEKASTFPGFVDVACGNGVLVYILLMEGYKGWGFDARRRKTWAIFPDWVQQKLQESLYIPKPFAAAASSQGEREGGISELDGIEYHTGDFPRDTFIISNHADELTVWTPLMAALACPEAPLPFISIPCCSHSLSGARYRYPPPKKQKNKPAKDDETDKEEKEEEQPATGDLKALREAKIAASTSQPGADLDSSAVLNSMYGSLTAKTMSIAAEIGYDVERTLLRIPSTRNMGVVGGRKSTVQKRVVNRQIDVAEGNVEELAAEIVRRECAKEGGIGIAANIWIQRAIGLQKSKKSASGGH